MIRALQFSFKAFGILTFVLWFALSSLAVFSSTIPTADACHDDEITVPDDLAGCSATTNPPEIDNDTGGGLPLEDSCLGSGVINNDCENPDLTPGSDGIPEGCVRLSDDVIDCREDAELYYGDSARLNCSYAGGRETSRATCLELAMLAQSREGQGVCEAPNAPGINVVDGDVNDGEQEACDCEGNVLSAGNCDIVAALEAGLNILTGVAGLAITGGIMYGSYLYMTGRDNPGQIAAARSKIVWALVALLILLFFWAFLQWLIPGGLLGGGRSSGSF